MAHLRKTTHAMPSESSMAARRALFDAGSAATNRSTVTPLHGGTRSTSTHAVRTGRQMGRLTGYWCISG